MTYPICWSRKMAVRVKLRRHVAFASTKLLGKLGKRTRNKKKKREESIENKNR